MKTGVFVIYDMPRILSGIPHVHTIGWLRGHSHPFHNDTMKMLFFCYTMRASTPNRHSLELVNGKRTETMFKGPTLDITTPGTVFTTLKQFLHDELFFAYQPDDFPGWEKLVPPGNFIPSPRFNELFFEVFRLLEVLHVNGTADRIDMLAHEFFLEAVLNSELSFGTDPRIQSIASFFTFNFHSPIDLDSLLKRYGLSRRSFYRLWKQHFKYSPRDFIVRKRLGFAMHLLRNSSLSILEIAMESGFSSAVYFSKCFREHYQMTPSEWRQKQDNKNLTP